MDTKLEKEVQVSTYYSRGTINVAEKKGGIKKCKSGDKTGLLADCGYSN